MNGKSSFAALLMVGGISLAFAVGYLMAKVSLSGRQNSDGLQKVSGYSLDRFIDEGGGGKLNQGKSWQEVKASVFARWEASPAVLVDFDLRDKTLRLLEKASDAELEAWMRELRSDYDTDYDKDISGMLREMIILVLVERGGAEFVRKLTAISRNDVDYDLDDVMDHWTRHNPKAVLEWLDGGNLPEEIAKDLEDYKEDAITELSGKDPVEYERRLAALDAETRESVLEYHAYRTGTAEHRNDLLERAATSPHGEAMALYDGLLLREAHYELQRAIATLEELPVSAADRATLDDRLVSALMNDSRFNASMEDKPPVLQYWIDRNPERQVPSLLLERFNDWSLIDSEKAVAWLAKLDSGFHYDALAMRLVYERTRFEDKDLTEIVGLAERIGDFKIREVANRRIKIVWKPDDAAKVAEWEQNLPEEDQKSLKRDFPDR